MKKLISDKRFKYGTYSTAITIVVIAILILINLVVGQFNKTADLTKNSTYSLSDETLQVIDRIDSDINIYTLFSENSSDGVLNKVEQVISRYSQKTSYIKVSNIDLYLHPDFTQKYTNENTTIGANSIIVEKDDKYRVISYSDYYTQGSSNYESSEELNIESNLTSAIQYVMMETASKIYFVTGHDETDFSHFTTLVERLKYSNYETEEINLLDNEIPDDCTVLFITPGARDYSEAEAEKIKKYLSNDGRAFFLLGGTDINNVKNLLSIVNAYGVTIDNGYVLEGNQANYYKYPYALFPEMTDHEINEEILSKDYRTYSIATQAIKDEEIKKQGLVTEPLLKTSADSYIKSSGNSSPNKEATDISGPFNLAVAVTDNTYTDTSHSTKVVVCGLSYYFMEPAYDNMVINSNTTFIVSALNWLNDNAESVAIASKTISTPLVVVDDQTANNIKLICWAVIPGCLFGTGFIVWLIRRNK